MDSISTTYTFSRVVTLSVQPLPPLLPTVAESATTERDWPIQATTQADGRPFTEFKKAPVTARTLPLSVNRTTLFSWCAPTFLHVASDSVIHTARNTQS